MRKKILLVEDEEIMLRFLKQRLEKEHYDVAVANDGREAMELVDSSSFDLIISDLMLPFVTGFELISHIRKSELNTETPLLIVSAMSADEVVVDALAVGASDFLRKPYSMDVMVAKVNLVLERQQELKADYQL